MIVFSWVFVLILPIVALCQPAEERIEDGLMSADEEGYLPEDSAFVFGTENAQSSQRVQMLNSTVFDANSGKRVTGSHVWVRSRLGVQADSRFRTDLLAVRRKYDPRAFDEVHVSISGRHDPTNVTFALGTFQHDGDLVLFPARALVLPENSLMQAQHSLRLDRVCLPARRPGSPAGSTG